jgi:Pyruvate/2-oxoacid:ferredoxin oxidoreductase delta subunit
MLRKGLIHAGKTESGGFGYSIMPFAVGIYEMQHDRINAEFAQLFEDYYTQAFAQISGTAPQIHRVIPVNETVQNDMEIQPFESVVTIIEESNAWGVVDCICRIQKDLVGDPCDHPLDVCMVFSKKPGAFDDQPDIAITKEEAYQTLKRAAEAGLVHSVNNSKGRDPYISKYICNCCTCSCGILRGVSELGMANVIARSAFVNTVDPDECAGCEICIEYCQFGALSLRPEDPYVQIDPAKCVGCGVCVPQCPDEALSMIRRPEDEILPVPETHDDWLEERAIARGIDLTKVM